VEDQLFDRHIREKMSGFVQDPPIGMWAGIEGSIGRQGKRRTMFLPLRVAAAVALLVMAGFAFRYVMIRQPDGSPLLGISVPEASLLVPETGHIRTITEPILLEKEELVQFLGNDYATAYTPSPAEETAGSSYAQLPGRLSPVFGSLVFASGSEDRSLLAKSVPLIDYTPESDTYRQLAMAPVWGSTSDRFSFSAYLAPQYNHRFISPGRHSLTPVVSLEGMEEEVFTYSYGLSVSFALSERWDIQTGASYVNTGQYLSDIWSYTHPSNLPVFAVHSELPFTHPQSILSSHGKIQLHDPGVFLEDVQSHRVLGVKDEIDAVDLEALGHYENGLLQHFRFVELPLIFRYKIIDRGVSLYVKTGMAGNYLIGNDIYLDRDMSGPSVGETLDMRNWHFSTIGGLVFSVPLSSRVNLVFEPTTQVFIMPYVKEELLTGRAFPYNFSLQTGISFGL
jgi:hypothetical protein